MLAVLRACPRERCSADCVAAVGALGLSPDAAAVAAWMAAAIKWAHAAQPGACASAAPRRARSLHALETLTRAAPRLRAAPAADGAAAPPSPAAPLHDALAEYLWAVAGPPALGVVSAHAARGRDVSVLARVLADAAAAAGAEAAAAGGASGGAAAATSAADVSDEVDLFVLRGALSYCAVRHTRVLCFVRHTCGNARRR